MNTKLHAVTDARGRPMRFFMTASQVSDYTGAAALLSSLPKADRLLADRGYDADWLHEALKDEGITPCIPGRKAQGKPVKYDKRRYRRRNRIEIMFGRLKDWRRVATRYDKCPKVFLSAFALAATVMFWLCVRTLGGTRRDSAIHKLNHINTRDLSVDKQGRQQNRLDRGVHEKHRFVHTYALSAPSIKLVIPEGIEPSTCRLEVGCSIQLSYGTTASFCAIGPDRARGSQRISVMKTELGSST